MADDVKALIAHLNERIKFNSETHGEDAWWRGHVQGMRDTVYELERVLAALEAAQVPATDDEREALARVIASGLDGWNDYDAASDEYKRELLAGADEVIAAGFRRSSRVPVSRDELAAFIAQWMADDHNGFGSCNAPRDMAGDILATHDIFPKAARKPADSSKGDHRG